MPFTALQMLLTDIQKDHFLDHVDFRQLSNMMIPRKKSDTNFDNETEPFNPVAANMCRQGREMIDLGNYPDLKVRGNGMYRTSSHNERRGLYEAVFIAIEEGRTEFTATDAKRAERRRDYHTILDWMCHASAEVAEIEYNWEEERRMRAEA